MWRGCSARRAARSQAVNGPQLQGHVGQEDGSGPAPFWGDEQTAGGGLASPTPLWGKKRWIRSHRTLTNVLSQACLRNLEKRKKDGVCTRQILPLQ